MARLNHGKPLSVGGVYVVLRRKLDADDVDDGERPAREYELAAFRLMYTDEAVEAVYRADSGREAAQIVKEYGKPQYMYDVRHELAGSGAGWSAGVLVSGDT